MRYRGVFFDLYGTLLVFGDMDAAWSDWLRALRRWLEDSGSEIESGKLARLCEAFFSRPAPRPPDDGLTLYEQRLRRLMVDLGLAVSGEALSSIAADTAACWHRHTRLAPNALELLAELSDRCSLALITNFDHPPHIDRVIRETGLEPYFNTIVISGAVGITKPDPEIVHHTLRLLDLSPEEVVLVGDSPEDMRAALDAGVTPIRISHGDRMNTVGATDFGLLTDANDDDLAGCRLVSSLTELAAVLSHN